MSQATREENTVGASELYIQKDFMAQVKAVNEAYYQKTGKRKKQCTITYGCQMNAHDSEKIIGMLTEMGYTTTKDESQADLIIYNTCCIRENAENKMYGNLGIVKGLKQKNKELKVILCGCMMQQDTVIEKISKSYNFVDIIFGTYNLYRLPQLLYTSMESKSQIIDIWQEQKETVEDLPSLRKDSFRASVNIMYGCDNYCTYCIVPYVRGRERSREVQDIIREVESLVQDGVKEIMLLGQNVNSYGKNLDNPVSFAELLHKVADVQGIERIRFMTSHPKDFSDDLIEVIRTRENVCNHVHLPVQSGSSKMLKRMNRYYDREQYLALVEKLKKAIPEVALTTDIIVGFPGETEEDHEATMDMVRQVKYASAFTFIYSRREGTPAARMAEQIPEETAKRRFNELLAALNPLIYEISKAQVGSTGKVLVESVSKQDEGIVSGRLDNNSLVHFKGGGELVGSIVDVRIIDCKTFYLIGEKI